ncbi:MAG TPA: hypothetical protein VLH40_03085 [Atribacteraceae bacterium]|nr:hypothetical protein [Atribacteraceae bacterium]
MSKWEKLLSKITALSKDVRFTKIQRILESYGYVGKNPGSGSSHWTFRKQGKPPITIPENEPIRLAYVRLVKDIIESGEE